MSTALITEKLTTDLLALTFANSSLIHPNVRMHYAANTMQPLDCIISMAGISENTEGASAGNQATTRQIGYELYCYETLESTASDAAADTKMKRLMNVLDAWQNYLQKEPNNLRGWGASNSLALHKIRLSGGGISTLATENGIAAVLRLPFTVFLNVIPQTL